MPCYDDAEIGLREYPSYLIEYGKSGGGEAAEGGCGANGDGSRINSNNHNSSNNNNGFSGSDDDDSTSCPDWTDDADDSSYSGSSGGSYSGSSGGGSSGGGSSVSSGDGGDDGQEKQGPAATARNNRNKWLKTLWTMIDGEQPRANKRPRQPVKTILRPPTTYAFVIGMSGLPSKVPVYPKRM